MARIDLRAAQWHAVIDAQLGGALLELSHAAQPVLRAATVEGVRRLGVRGCACYPMVPFANRIAYGQLNVGGRDYALRANFPPEPHAIHGLGWQRSWSLVDQAESSAELILRHDGGSLGDWPFAFEARQRFELSPAGLHISISLANRDREAWPGGMGLHPYFSVQGEQALQFEADGAWQNGPDHLPRDRVFGTDWDFRHARRVAELDLDHDFSHWRGWARLYGGAAGTVRITASEVFRVLRVFTPPGRGFLAIEPVSHGADAVHRAGEPGVGFQLLAPGEAMTGRVDISLEESA
ncbi:MAG: aldose 1-epimerase [Steroidobacteraceae bacterium]